MVPEVNWTVSTKKSPFQSPTLFSSCTRRSLPTVPSLQDLCHRVLPFRGLLPIEGVEVPYFRSLHRRD